MFRYAELEFVLGLKAATLASVLRITADYAIISMSGFVGGSIVSVMSKTKIYMELL